MKDSIAWLGNTDEFQLRELGQPRFAHSWRHQYGLSAKAGVPLDVIEVCLLKKTSNRDEC